MRLSGRDSGKNSLSPIDPEQLLQGLRLTTGKAAEFCNISRRQLCYWTDKGIVETVEGNDGDDLGEDGTRRVYDFIALRRVLLIKQLLEQGCGLKRATREVESYLLHKGEEDLEIGADRRTREEQLQHQTERLEIIANQVRSAVQRGRLNAADLRELARDIHFFLELTAYEEGATLQLQEDAVVANQFRSMIDQLSLHVEDRAMEPPTALRRGAR